jgi:hypothetical protein
MTPLRTISVTTGSAWVLRRLFVLGLRAIEFIPP